jgi:excinuclease ABC subunit A
VKCRGFFFKTGPSLIKSFQGSAASTDRYFLWAPTSTNPGRCCTSAPSWHYYRMAHDKIIIKGACSTTSSASTSKSPRPLVVITGSASTLAFDTIYAETASCRIALVLCPPVPGADGKTGRRVDQALTGHIDRAKTTSKPRSTVGTSMRSTTTCAAVARVGHPLSSCNKEITSQTVSQMVDQIMTCQRS